MKNWILTAAFLFFAYGIAYSQATPTATPTPNLNATGPCGSLFTNMTAGPGCVQIDGTNPGAPSCAAGSYMKNVNISNATIGANVNNVLNAATFPGADIGAQVNNAVKALPTNYMANVAGFTGSIAGNLLTVTALSATQGGVDVGLIVKGTGVPANTTITSRGTGTGGTGTYGISTTATVASEAMTGDYAYPFGTVYIPQSSGIQTFANMIGGLNNPVMTFVSLKCEDGARLQYTGSGNYWIDMIERFAQNSYAGGVYNCTFLAPASPPVGQAVIHFGNEHGFHVIGNKVMGMNANGDTGVLAEDTVYFTEDYHIEGNDFITNTNAVWFNVPTHPTGANAYADFMHGTLDYYCNTSYVTANSQSCLQNTGGANTMDNTMNMRFNLDTNSSWVIYNDTSSKFYQNVGNISGENDAPTGGYMWYSGGNYQEWNNIHGFCMGCKDVAPFQAGAAIDGVISSGPAALGALAPGAWLNGLDNVTQLLGLVSIRCRNITAGTCTTPPTVALWNGSSDLVQLACPTTATEAVSTSFTTAAAYPSTQLTLRIAYGGVSCSAPMFAVSVHTRAN